MVTMIAFGSNNIDEYYDISHWPAVGEKAFIENQKIHLGGMIGNSAHVYAQLGNSTVIFDYLPPCPETDYIIERLNYAKIDTRFISINEKYAINHCFVFKHQGERIVYVKKNNAKKIQLTELQQSLLVNNKFFYCNIEDLNQLIDFQKVIDSPVQLVMDIEHLALQRIKDPWVLLRAAKILFINQNAHQYLQKLDSQYYEALKAYIIVITQGSNGSMLYYENQWFQISPCPTNLVDSTGAGDTHHAAFLHAITHDYNVFEASRFASAAASYAISSVGPRADFDNEDTVIAFAEEMNYPIREKK